MHTLNNYVQAVLKKPIFRELSWYATAQIAVQGFSFLSVIVVSRYLGPSQLGLYSFVLNYVAVFLSFAGAMDFYFMWKIAKSNDYFSDVSEYIGHKINIYIILSVAGIISAWLILPRDVAIFASIMLALVFVQSLGIFSLYAVATKRAKLTSFVQILTSGLLFVAKIALVIFKAPLLGFIVVSAIDLILTGVIMSLYFLQTPEWKNTFSLFKLPPFLRSVVFYYSIRASVIAIVFWQFLLRIDQLILATFSNAYTLGIYSAAVKVAEVPNFLAGVLSTAMIPSIAHAALREDDFSKNNLKKMTLVYLGTGAVIATLIILLAPMIINILYGGKFIGSVSVLRAYALSIPGMFMNYFFLGIYGAKDRHHHQVAIFGISLIVNAILVYAMTPFFGLVGTALATATAYTIAALGFYINLENKK